MESTWLSRTEDATVFRVGGRDYGCPLHLSLAVLTGKWKGLVIWFLYEAGTLRYGELKRRANEYVTVSDKMLIASLRELERDGLVVREVFRVVPPRVEYALTKAGKRAVPVIEAMEKFGSAYETDTGAPNSPPQPAHRGKAGSRQGNEPRRVRR